MGIKVRDSQVIDSSEFALSAATTTLAVATDGTAFAPLPTATPEAGALLPAAVPDALAADWASFSMLAGAAPSAPLPSATPVAQPRISVADMVVGESDAFVDVVVRLSAPGLNAVTVNYTTADGTAGSYVGYEDYVGTTGTLSFAIGETEKTVRIELRDGATREAYESFLFNLNTPTNAIIADASANIGMVDDDSIVDTPGLFVRDVIVDEKNGTASFVVMLGGPDGQASNGEVTVNYATSNGTALSGSDYDATSGTLTFAAGETVKTVVIDINDDSAVERGERFNLDLSSAVGANIVDGRGVATIGANDATGVAQPRISVSDLVVSESEGYVDVVVQLSAPGQNSVTVAYDTVDATAGEYVGYEDYLNTSGTLNFAVGETTKTVRVTLRDGDTIEGFEHFLFRLTDPTNATVANQWSTISIVDDDSIVDTPSLSVRDVTIDEKAGTASFVVMLGGPDGQASNSSVTVNYATANAGATAGSDYTAATGALTFAAGETVKTIVVDINDDTTAEGIERFQLNLSNANGATIVDGRGIATIGANDKTSVAQPRLSVSDMVVSESDGYVDVVLSLSAPGQNVVTVDYTTVDSTAANYVSYEDYVASGSKVTFAVGETTKVVRVQLRDGDTVEGYESFLFNLSNATNATIADGSAQIGIVDDDNVVDTPGLYVRDVIVDEKDGTASFVVMLGGPNGQASNSPVSVNYATANSGAAAGSDYISSTGALVFAAGETVKTVIVDINDDTTAEGIERFTLNLSNANGATIIDGRGVATIGANDKVTVAQPRILVSDMIAGESDGYVDIVVSLSAPGQNPVTVKYTTADSTANDYSSYDDYVGTSGTLNFAVGETTKVVRVQLRDGAVDENMEAFLFNLSEATNGTIADTSALIGLVDDDNVVDTPGLYVRDVVVDEKAGTATFAVLLGGGEGQASNSPITVNYATGGGTATAGSDYTSVSGTLVFAAGDTVKNIVVDITDDSLSESLERINLTLSNASGALVIDGNGVAEIGANDRALTAQPHITVADMVASENDGYIDVAVNLSAPSASAVSVSYTTVNNTAGNYYYEDFVGVTGTLNFAAGETTKFVRIQLQEGATIEQIEAFYFNLSAAVNAVIDKPSTSITLYDNDTAGNAVLSHGRSDDVYVVNAGNDFIVENVGGGTDLVRSSVTYTLGSELENLTLTGSGPINGTGNVKNNKLVGNSGANTLNGLAGNDTLDGAGGNDAMYGGSGNDTYVLTQTGDTAIESSASGGTSDTVLSARTYTLGLYLENLTLTGSSAISGTGNTQSNRIIGNAGANKLSGGSGNDTLNGGLGNDTLIGGVGNDTYVLESAGDVLTETNGTVNGIDTVLVNRSFALGANLENLTLTGTGAYTGTGNAQANRITGNGAANKLDGGAGNDTLDGGAGADTMIGGTGNDSFVIDNAGDVITESALSTGGIDTVQSYRSYTLTAGLEYLTLLGTANLNAAGNAGSNRLTGNSGVNTLSGGDGNDTLNGGLGADKMSGGNGNDTYVVDNSGDVVTEGASATSGTDTVQSSRSYTLGTNVENLTLTGTAIIGNGNASRNVLTGNNASNQLNGGSNNDTLNGGGGNDTLNGGTGADSMVGGTGNDTYYVDDASDKVVELAGSVAGTADRVISSISYSIASATAVENLTLSGTATTGTGNSLGNRIIGNSAANVLTGGAGSDRVTGGAGADTFVFTSKSGSDLITDFDHSDDRFRFDQSGLRIGDGDATVDLGGTTSGSGGFSTSREVVIFTSDIFGDINRDSAAGMIGSANSSFSTGAQRLFVVDNGTESGIYLFTSSGANATVSASELTLIAMVQGETTTLADYTFVL